jgi:hypothetical protein
VSSKSGKLAFPDEVFEMTDYTSRFLISREDAIAAGIRDDLIVMYQKLKYRKAYGVPTWYHAIQAHTFRTTVHPFLWDEAKVIRRLNLRETLSDDDRETLSGLSSKLTSWLADFPSGAFFKLDLRSPKDVPAHGVTPADPKLSRLFDAELDKLRGEWTPNAVAVAWLGATLRFQRVTTADEVIFLMGHSDRIYEDLTTTCSFPPEHFEMSLVLREWDDNVPDHQMREFRGFVHNASLNAISQYAHDIRCQYIVDHRDEIARRLLDFFESIKGQIPHESYVIDFIVFDDWIKVVELNPFHAGAVPGLFSWADPDDRERFLNGPFELRIQEQELESLEEILLPEWINFVGSARKKRRGRCEVQ